ncbi:hypothetical protein NL521_28405, partial [Klebsiella pneumoniae]|nr:hypothetical protein [Klebsiella pneumoniae]
ISGADLQYIGILTDNVNSGGIKNLGHNFQASPLSGFSQQFQAFFFQSLKRVWRSAWFVGSTPQKLRTCSFNRASGFQ